MTAKTTTRVEEHSSPEANARVERGIQRSIDLHKNAGRARIERRLEELDREWDIERAIEANASTAVLVSLALGGLVSRRFFLLTAAIGGFLLQHAVQGWCPPVPALRRLGFRTPREIEKERAGLRGLLDSARRSNGAP